MDPKVKVLIIGIGIIMLIVITGYIEELQQKPIDTSSSTPFFPVQNNPSEFRMTALIEGELVLEDGCLRVRVDDGYDNYLLVWPYGFSVSTEDGIIQIIDDTGQPIARVGDRIKVGGGECVKPCEHIAQYSAELPSDRCSGPYWIVGEVLTNGWKFKENESVVYVYTENATEQFIISNHVARTMTVRSGVSGRLVKNRVFPKSE